MELWKAPNMTTGHRVIGYAALFGSAFIPLHLATIIVTVVEEGWGWGMSAWCLDITGYVAAIGFAALCWKSSNTDAREFKKENSYIILWALITFGVRCLDNLMLFGAVSIPSIYVQPHGAVLYANIVSEVVVGYTFTILACIGSIMLYIEAGDEGSSEWDSDDSIVQMSKTSTTNNPVNQHSV